MKPILEIQNISKKFKINHEQQPYLSLRDSISKMFSPKKRTEDFWALNDVSFNVEQGDTIGIIGKNGAGKSTLLKILSRITPPTSGKITVRGRIASLLEVGTGFHPELSGRENIFMNGSLLGMRRHEILKNFAAIVEFAGVEKFIDTPLKHYSSGMQLRLAFAVAAFLENEILIIDEVLAVGDAEFQKKCMGKMSEVSKSGRTVLFVSHNIGAISQLCTKSALLKNGCLLDFSKTSFVIDKYLKNDVSEKTNLDRRHLPKWGGKNQFTNFILANSNNEIMFEFKHDDPIVIKVDLFLPQYNPALEVAVSLYDRMKNRIFTIHENVHKYYDSNSQMSKFKIIIPNGFITPGNYSWLMCILHQGVEIYDIHDDICNFEIIDNGSVFLNYSGGSYGSIFANYKIEKQ